MHRNASASLRFRLFCLAWLTTASFLPQEAGAGDRTPADAALPTVAEDVDEFYAHVDRINSPTELTVTILDLWQPMDKVKGPRWPEGRAKVKPAERIVALEEIAVPGNADDQKAALAFAAKTLRQSKDEVICSGSSVVVGKESGKQTIRIKAYVFVKDGFTLNNALVRQGLATTTNPIYKSWEQEAKQKRLGIWRNTK